MCPGLNTSLGGELSGLTEALMDLWCLVLYKFSHSHLIESHWAYHETLYWRHLHKLWVGFSAAAKLLQYWIEGSLMISAIVLAICCLSDISNPLESTAARAFKTAVACRTLLLMLV